MFFNHTFNNLSMLQQDEPLTIRIMDYDTYSANDAIGKVYIDLNPLLWPSTPSPIKKDPTDGSTKEDNNKHPGWLKSRSDIRK